MIGLLILSELLDDCLEFCVTCELSLEDNIRGGVEELLEVVVVKLRLV